MNVPERSEEIAVGDRVMITYDNQQLKGSPEGIFYVKTTNLTKQFIDLPQTNDGFLGGASAAQGNS